MANLMFGRAVASRTLIVLLGFVVIGQHQQPANPKEKAPDPAPPSRDNLGPHEGTFKRLSPRTIDLEARLLDLFFRPTRLLFCIIEFTPPLSVCFLP